MAYLRLLSCYLWLHFHLHGPTRPFSMAGGTRLSQQSQPRGSSEPHWSICLELSGEQSSMVITAKNGEQAQEHQGRKKQLIE